jgi:hypothetical protein
MRTRVVLLAALSSWACASERGGPTPAVTAVSPDLVCNAQGPTDVTLTGTGFSPAAVDVLAGEPRVIMPRVIFTGGGTTYEVPPESVTLPGGDRTGTMLAAQIPMGSLPPRASTDPAVTYAVEVVNANGNAGSRPNALTVVPPPTLSAIEPSSGAQNTLVMVTLTGLAFREGMTVTLEAAPPVAATGVTVTPPTSATATFDLTNVAVGTYDVTVRNADGCSFTLPQAFTVFVPRIIEVTGIDPPFGCTCDTTTVTISSSSGGFRSTPIVELRPTGMPTAAPALLTRVAFVSETTLTAVVPQGLAVGTYDVTVKNPPYDGGVGTLMAGFRVVMNPIPIVTQVAPPGATTQETPTLTITGENFRNTVKVELIGAASPTPVFTRAGIAPSSATEVALTLPANTLATAPYLVRVWNEDEQTYFTFAAFLVTNPSDKLNVFSASPRQLVTGRRLPAGASAVDDLGNHYVYAIGGDSGSAPLASVEVNQLARFGDLGEWRQIDRNPLTTPRAGAAAVTVAGMGDKRYVYVLGGLGTAGALASVERAVVLATADAPAVTGATRVAGTLDSGTWYYKVSAVLAAADPDNPGGETLASDEEIVTLGTAGGVTLSWNAVMVNGAPAASYRVYRTDEVNGRSQTEHLIGETTTTSFTDDGKPAGTEPFLPDGSLGRWKVVGAGLAAARWGHQAVLAGNHVVVLGGKSAPMGGVLASVEHAAFSAQGELGAFSAGTALPAPRAFFSAALATRDNSKLPAATPLRIWITAGIDAEARTLDTVLRGDVAADGSNGAWTQIARTTNSRVGGVMAVITRNALFTLGGAGTVTDGSGGPTFGGVTLAGRQMIFDDQGGDGNPFSSTSNGLIAPRAFGVTVQNAGLIYFIGGTSDGANALRTTEITF